MRLLLDTHVFLWWRMDDPSLGADARALIADGSNPVVVSAAVAWEIAIKRSLGKLEFEGSVAAAIREEGFTPLSVGVGHCDELRRLVRHHADPFDRMLVAQARCERLTLVTHDPAILVYEGFDSVRT